MTAQLRWQINQLRNSLKAPRISLTRYQILLRFIGTSALQSDRGSERLQSDPACFNPAFQNIGKGRICPSESKPKTKGKS